MLDGDVAPIGCVPPVIEDPVTYRGQMGLPANRNVTRSAFRFEAIQQLFSTKLTELERQGAALVRADGATSEPPPNVLRSILLRY